MPYKDYAKRKEMTDRWRERNPDRMREYNQRYQPWKRNWRLMRSYGISQARYEEMVAEQEGKCAICRAAPEESLVVDHCHGTGRVRALLCHRCNVSIGLFGDNAATISKAAAYVAHHAEKHRESA